jgi:hypothetical protein
MSDLELIPEDPDDPRLTRLHSLFRHSALFSGQLVPLGKSYPDLFLHANSTMAQTVAIRRDPDTVSGILDCLHDGSVGQDIVVQWTYELDVPRQS